MERIRFQKKPKICVNGKKSDAPWIVGKFGRRTGNSIRFLETETRKSRLEKSRFVWKFENIAFVMISLGKKFEKSRQIMEIGRIGSGDEENMPFIGKWLKRNFGIAKKFFESGGCEVGEVAIEEIEKSIRNGKSEIGSGREMVGIDDGEEFSDCGINERGEGKTADGRKNIH
jgi:hypothetical protein